MHAIMTHSELDCMHGDVCTVVVGCEHGSDCDSHRGLDNKIGGLLHLANSLHGPSVIFDIVRTVWEEAISTPSTLLRLSCNVDIDFIWSRDSSTPCKYLPVPVPETISTHISKDLVYLVFDETEMLHSRMSSSPSRMCYR